MVNPSIFTDLSADIWFKIHIILFIDSSIIPESNFLPEKLEERIWKWMNVISWTWWEQFSGTRINRILNWLIYVFVSVSIHLCISLFFWERPHTIMYKSGDTHYKRGHTLWVRTHTIRENTHREKGHTR